MDRDVAGRIDLHHAERTVGARTVILGGASHSGADDDSTLRVRFLFDPLPPDRMVFQFIEDLRRADRDGVRISGHHATAGLQRIAPAELDRVERQ